MENKQNFPGTFIPDCSITGTKYEPGSEVTYQIYLPPACDGVKDPALYVLLEHLPENMAPVLAKLMAEEVIPPGMVLFCISGNLPPSLPGGTARGMRAEEFDQYGPEFSNFLVEELIPAACKTANIHLSPDPDMHFITGGSSGGLASWNAVWFRNDYFRRAFLSSPTFSAMRGGEEPMVLVRKTEARPIRLYITSGSEEPDYFFGSSLIAAQNAAYALEFAGYDLRFEQFNAEGHCCRRESENLWRRMMAFVWANWKTTPVRPLFNQPRIRSLVKGGWTPCEHTFRSSREIVAEQGIYSFSGGQILLKKNGETTVAADGFDEISSIQISTDRWRMYIADRKRRFIYAMSIQPDGSLTGLYKLASLHLAHDCRTIGAVDTALLANDRLLTATELGIQGIVSFGLTDLILPLPGDLPADRVEVEGNMLFAASGDRVFCRELKTGAADPAQKIAPSTPGYGDGFDYSRSHFTAV